MHEYFFTPARGHASPYINHFLQPDTLISDYTNLQILNRYSYVGNRPINFNDPTGHCPEEMAECRKILSDLLPKPKGGGGNSDGGRGGGGENEGNGATYEDGLIGPPAPTLSDILGYPPPTSKTLHPLDGNVILQEPIYDYSTNPPKVIGYRVTSYAYDNVHGGFWDAVKGAVIPTDPIAFSSYAKSIIEYLIKPMAPGAEFAIPGVV